MKPSGLKLSVASPCPAKWADMNGDDRARFCERCQKHVYNIAEFTRAEVLSLIEKNERKLCVRMYRRADGTVMTADCPVGIARVRRVIVLAAFAAVAVLLAPLLVFSVFRDDSIVFDLPGVRTFWGSEATGTLAADTLPPPPRRLAQNSPYTNQNTY